MNFRSSPALLSLPLLLAATACGAAPSSTGSESTTESTAALADTTTSYSCTSPVGNITASAVISGTSAATAKVGGRVPLKGFQWTVDLPASLVNEAISFGATTANGDATTLDVNVTDADKASVNAAKKHIDFGPVTLVKNQALAISFPTDPETLKGFTAAAAGTMTFTPGKMSFSVTLGGLGTSTVSCTTSAPTTISTTTVK